MPPPRRKKTANNAHTVLWVALAFVCVCAASVGIYFVVKGAGKKPPAADEPPVSVQNALDPGSVEHTRAWAAELVKRLKEVEDRKNDAATKTEIARVEKEIKDTLLGKQVRWTFSVLAVDEGELKMESFFGMDAGWFSGDDPKLVGRPMRRLYFRVYFADDEAVVKVGDEVTAAEASRLRNGGTFTVVRTVTEAMLSRHDKWVSASAYSDVVDVLEPYCVTVVLSRTR